MEALNDCRVFITFFQLLVGALAPTILAAKLPSIMPAAVAPEALSPPHRDSAEGSSGGGNSNGQDDEGSSLATAGASGMRAFPTRRLCSWLLHAAAGLEGGLHHLCDLLTHSAGSGSWVLTAAAWWLLISLMWVLALLLEQPGAASAMVEAAAALAA